MRPGDNENNNKRMNREEKVLEIVRISKVGNISCEEAAIQICLLFSVVGQSEQLVCGECGYPMFYHKPDDIMYCHGCNNTKPAN